MTKIASNTLNALQGVRRVTHPLDRTCAPVLSCEVWTLIVDWWYKWAKLVPVQTTMVQMGEMCSGSGFILAENLVLNGPGLYMVGFPLAVVIWY